MPARERLPDRRRSYVHKVHIAGHSVYLGVGLYDDGRCGEIWLDMSREGAALRFWAGAAATMFSICLQCGCPLETLVNRYLGSRSEPCGPVSGHERITRCTSIMDFVARALGLDFLDRNDLADVEVTT